MHRPSLFRKSFIKASGMVRRATRATASSLFQSKTIQRAVTQIIQNVPKSADPGSLLRTQAFNIAQYAALQKFSPWISALGVISPYLWAATRPYHSGYLCDGIPTVPLPSLRASQRPGYRKQFKEDVACRAIAAAMFRKRKNIEGQQKLSQTNEPRIIFSRFVPPNTFITSTPALDSLHDQVVGIPTEIPSDLSTHLTAGAFLGCLPHDDDLPLYLLRSTTTWIKKFTNNPVVAKRMS